MLTSSRKFTGFAHEPRSVISDSFACNLIGDDLFPNKISYCYLSKKVLRMLKHYLKILIPVFGSVMVVISCEVESDKPTYEKGDLLQTGVASWYGPGFHGRLTSNRERYDQDDYTAAHRTLPFDTVVEVINTENEKSVEVRINDRGPYVGERIMENEKSVEVRINDRGPYVGERIIDLSRAAAEEIGLLDSGITEVEIKLVEAGGNIPEDLEQRFYTIQIAEYFTSFHAEQFMDEVGDGARIEQEFSDGLDLTRYHIYYGNYEHIDSARVDLQKLEERGFEGFVKQVN